MLTYMSGVPTSFKSKQILKVHKYRYINCIREEKINIPQDNHEHPCFCVQGLNNFKKVYLSAIN